MPQKDESQRLAERVLKWRYDSLLWFKDIFGDNIKNLGKTQTETGLSRQQEHAFRELDKLIGAKLKSAFGRKLTDEEKVYAQKIGISIMSGTGTGKDFWASLVAWSFLQRFPYPRILCTANTDKQLKNVLWSQFSTTGRLSKDNGKGTPILNDQFEIHAEKIFLKELPEAQRGKEWFAEAVTINTKASEEEQAEALGGRHSDYMLILVDEASGIPDAVFKPLERTLTGILNVVVMIFNPTRSKGFARESQYSDQRWIRIRWDAEESELVSKEHIESMESTYGRDSNTFRIGVLGLPPVFDSETLIHPDWIQDAIERPVLNSDFDPVILSVDVGGGGDKGIITARQGAKIFPQMKFTTADTMVLTGHVVRAIDQFDPAAVFVDNIGIGLGVFNRLRELGERYRKIVYPADVRASAYKKEKFFRRRDELWWEVRDRFEQGLVSIPKDVNLIDQLNSLAWEPDSSGKVKIDSKARLKQKIGHSPDEADGVMMTYYHPDYLYRHVKDKEEEGYKIDVLRGMDQGQAWMGA